jgi:hypothetical protein
MHFQLRSQFEEIVLQRQIHRVSSHPLRPTCFAQPRHTHRSLTSKPRCIASTESANSYPPPPSCPPARRPPSPHGPGSQYRPHPRPAATTAAAATAVPLNAHSQRLAPTPRPPASRRATPRAKRTAGSPLDIEAAGAGREYSAGRLRKLPPCSSVVKAQPPTREQLESGEFDAARSSPPRGRRRRLPRQC